jgi:hypothetical protein
MGCCARLDTGEKKMSVFSGFRREGDENCALLGCYTARSGNFLPTFRDNKNDFALLSESYLIHTSIQDCYLLAKKQLKVDIISKEQLLFVVLRFCVSPLVTSLSIVFVSSCE